MRYAMSHYKINSNRMIDYDGSLQPCRSLCSDLMVEFIVTHMMKDFPMDLYL